MYISSCIAIMCTCHVMFYISWHGLPCTVYRVYCTLYTFSFLFFFFKKKYVSCKVHSFMFYVLCPVCFLSDTQFHALYIVHCFFISCYVMPCTVYSVHCALFFLYVSCQVHNFMFYVLCSSCFMFHVLCPVCFMSDIQFHARYTVLCFMFYVHPLSYFMFSMFHVRYTVSCCVQCTLFYVFCYASCIAIMCTCHNMYSVHCFFVLCFIFARCIVLFLIIKL